MTLTKSVLKSFIGSHILLLDWILISSMVYAQPADLGAFGSHNDFPNGIATYSITSEERMMVDYVFAFINYTFVNSDGKTISISEDQAKYGEGQIKSVVGQMVHITNEINRDDHSACTSDIRGTNGADFPPNGTPWIALIRRGNCTFEEKVRNVYFKRAIGAIIYNDKEATILDKMKIIDKESKCSFLYSII